MSTTASLAKMKIGYYTRILSSSSMTDSSASSPWSSEVFLIHLRPASSSSAGSLSYPSWPYRGSVTGLVSARQNKQEAFIPIPQSSNKKKVPPSGKKTLLSRPRKPPRLLWRLTVHPGLSPNETLNFQLRLIDPRPSKWHFLVPEPPHLNALALDAQLSQNAPDLLRMLRSRNGLDHAVRSRHKDERLLPVL